LPIILNGNYCQGVHIEQLRDEVLIEEEVVLVGEFSALIGRTLFVLDVAHLFPLLVALVKLLTIVCLQLLFEKVQW
jgi:hypothetical protein